MKTVMAALAAVLISGVAFADTDSRLAKDATQLTLDHNQLEKAGTKTAAPDTKQVTDQRSPERFTATAQSGQPPRGPGSMSNKAPAFENSMKQGSMKGPHDAAKSDANTADASGSMGTGHSSGFSPQEIKAQPHDAAKSDANAADGAGSIGSGDSTRGHNTSVAKQTPHNAAKADANNADASGSMGTGHSAPNARSERAINIGGMKNDGRSEAVHHEGVHGGVSEGHFGGGAGGGHVGVCRHGQGC